MKIGWLQVDCCQFFVRHFDTRWIETLVEFGLDFETLWSRSRRNQVEDDFVTHQRSATPILRDVAKHAMLNLVPLAGARRKVADLQRNAQPIGQVLQGNFPQPVTASIAAPTVRRDQRLARLTMMLHAHFAPPTPNRLRRKSSRIVIDADADPTLVFSQVVHPVGNGLAQVLVNEVVEQDFYGLTPGLPLTAAHAEFADQLLLFGVYRNDRLTPLLKGLNRSGGRVKELTT